MNPTPRFEAAARRVLEGDESREAAAFLEGVAIDDYPGDERLDELLYKLSLYSPGAGAPYCDAEEVREALKQALSNLCHPLGCG